MATVERHTYVLCCDGCGGDGPTIDRDRDAGAAWDATEHAQKAAVAIGWWRAPKYGPLHTTVVLCPGCTALVAQHEARERARRERNPNGRRKR